MSSGIVKARQDLWRKNCMCDNSGTETMVEYSMICLLLFPTLQVMLC